LSVDRHAAYALARAVLDAGVDVALSERMYVDHGFSQPLQLLLGGVATLPVVPVFINSVAEPLGPIRRARLLGEAIGSAAVRLDRRVLFIASGGLSHDPPIPQLATASPDIAARLISEGRVLTPQQRAEREKRVIESGRDFAAGLATLQPINPEWDRTLMRLLAAGDFDTIDGWGTDEVTDAAGHSAHEVRTWVAAYAAMAASGPYHVTHSYYEPIPEWVAGFGITTARSAATYH